MNRLQPWKNMDPFLVPPKAFPILLPSFLAILLSQLAFAQHSTVLFNSSHPLSWTNADSSTAIRTYMFPQHLVIRVILLTRGNPEVYVTSLIFGPGFYCDREKSIRCNLSVLLLECSTDGVVITERYPQVVWTANNNSNVEENAVLHADPFRGLVLTNTVGFDVFFTKLSGNFAAGMTLKEDGELVLFKITNSIIWRSSDFLTNTLLVGQGLREGFKLTRLSNNIVFSLSITSESLTAFVDNEKPVAYLSLKPEGIISNSSTLIQVIFTPTNITFTYKLGDWNYNLYKPTGMLSQIQLLRLGMDGGLRIYAWKAHSGWTGINLLDPCQIPMEGLHTELSIPFPGSSDLYFPTQYSQSFFTQCMACLWKQNLSYWRNPPYTAVRFFFTLVIALLFGTIFWDLGTKRKRDQDILNAMASMYSAVLFIGIQNASSVQPVVAIKRTVFYREREAGMYSALPYALGQVAIELPYILVQCLMYGVIVYTMIGFEWTITKFLWYMFFMYFTFLYFTFYGMKAVGLTPNHNIAAIVSLHFMRYGIFSRDSSSHRRGFLCGGDGIIGYALSHGACMGWLPLNLEM